MSVPSRDNASSMIVPGGEIPQSVVTLYQAYEIVTSKNPYHRFDEAHWKKIAAGLRSETEIRLTKQLRFLSVLSEIYVLDNELLLDLAVDILNTLQWKYHNLFRPTLDALISVITSCGRHPTCTPSHQAFVASAFSFITGLLSKEQSKKSFDIVCNKLLLPWAQIRSQIDDCAAIDEMVCRHLFCQETIEEFRLNDDFFGGDGGPSPKKGRYQSYTAKLFAKLQTITSVIPVLLRRFLQSSRECPIQDAKISSADMKFAMLLLDVVAQQPGSDERIVLFQSVFTLVHQHRLYHPNQHVSNSQRSKFVSYLDGILLGCNHELVFGAVAALLRIDHVFVEDRLVSIWKWIGEHRDEDWSKSLATNIVSAYADLRQMSVAFKSFLQSFMNVRLSSFISTRIFARIPIPQLPVLVNELLPFLNTNVNPIAIADILGSVLDLIPPHIPDVYDEVVKSLNDCCDMPLEQRLSLYTASRRVRARRNLALFLPDALMALPFDFLCDFQGADLDLLLGFDRLTPGIVSAVVFCLEEIHSRSLVSSYKIGRKMVQRLSQSLTSDTWCFINAHVALFLTFSKSSAVHVFADFIVRDDLRLLLLEPSLLERRELRCALVPHLERAIRHQPLLLETLSDLPGDYLNDPVMEPVARTIFSEVGPHHRIWVRVAALTTWPLMQLEANELLGWVSRSPSPQDLVSVILSNRLLDLIQPFAQFALSNPSLHLDCVLVKAIVAHLDRDHESCSEAHHRPLDHVSEIKPTFTIAGEIMNAIDLIVNHLPQECTNESALTLISHLLRFQALSSSEFVSSHAGLLLAPVMSRVPRLIGFVQSRGSSEAGRLFMGSVASVIHLVESCVSGVLALCNWLLTDPCPHICSTFSQASNPSQFQAVIVFLRPNLPLSKNAVTAVFVLMSHIRYRTGHCRIIEKHSTGLIIGLGSAIGQGIDDAIDALFAIANDLRSVRLSSHQVALIVSALNPALTRLETSSHAIASISRLMFALLRYRSESVTSSLPLFCEQVLVLFRAAVRSPVSSTTLLDNVSRIFLQLSRLQPVAFLSPRLIFEYFRVAASHPIVDSEKREAVTHGVMGLFDIVDREQIHAAYSDLDGRSQALFQTCHKQYLRKYKYYGRC